MCCGNEWFQFKLVYIKEHDHNVFLIVDLERSGDASDDYHDERMFTSSRHELSYLWIFCVHDQIRNFEIHC